MFGKIQEDIFNMRLLIAPGFFSPTKLIIFVKNYALRDSKRSTCELFLHQRVSKQIPRTKKVNIYFLYTASVVFRPHVNVREIPEVQGCNNAMSIDFCLS